MLFMSTVVDTVKAIPEAVHTWIMCASKMAKCTKRYMKVHLKSFRNSVTCCYLALRNIMDRLPTIKRILQEVG